MKEDINFKPPLPSKVQLDEKTLKNIIQRVTMRLMRLLGPRPDLEDLVQASMEQFLKAIAGFRGESSLEYFTESVALNVARNYLRRLALTTRIFDLFTEPADKPSAMAAQDTAAYEKEIFGRIMDHLNRIAVKKRIVFCMYYFEGKGLAEIAGELGANPETVKVRLFHARKELLRLGMKDPCIREWLEKAREPGRPDQDEE